MQNRFLHFSAISIIKFASKTRVFFPSMPSAERTNRINKFPLIVAILTMIVVVYFLPPIKGCSHWLFLVIVAVVVPQSGVNYGLSITFP